MTDRTAPHSNDQPAAVPGVASQDVIALVEALPGVALLLAADPPRFTMLAMNAGRLAETSTTREETVGRPLFEVFPEADATSRALEAPRPERTSLETVIRTRVPEHLSLLRLDLRRPDGASEVRYWAARNIPVLGPDGAVRYLLHQAEDVTAAVLGGDALAHAEDALRRQNERLAAQTRALELERSRLATVFAQAPSVLAIVRGPDYVLEMANEAYLALNGHRDVLGKPLLDAIPELRGQGFDRLLDEVVATGVPFVGREVPIWLSTLPGAPPEERFFDFAYLPLLEPDETGNPVRVGVIAHGNDITAQVRARREEERARVRADRLQRLTAALAATTSPETVAAVVITEGVAVMGAATGMLAVRTLATEPQAVIIRQQGLSAPVLAEFARFPLSAPNPAAECMRLGAPVFLETRDAVLARFPAIPRVWESLGTQTLATVPLAVAGETVGAMSFTWTAPRALPPEDREFLLALGRQAAQAIERARLLDAERAARAEAEAAREQAEEAHRAATQASQAKSAFLATMSHELRTPINAMIGYAQLLDLGLAGPLTEQQRGYLDRLAASSQHLLGLVNDVLDLSRIEAGETRVTHDDAWTGTSVAAALDLVLPLAAAKGVRLLDERIDDQGVPYVGDEDRVRQIVVNLLSNAVKFTPREGTITVTCDVAEETPEASGRLHGGGPWAYVRVTDSGVGIPHAEQVRIFEPFHQVDSGHTRRQGGTGLGLAISRRLARLMGGDLSVESTPGVGSTFTLWLPSTRRRGGLPAETAAERGARAERGLGLLQAPGLGEIGELLRAAAHEILHAYTDRLRADPSLPRVRELRRIQLEDHQSSFLADLAQSLVILQEAGRAAAEEIRDGSAIQRIIADAHGSRRFAQGWDEAAVRRDYQILREEIERAIRGRLRAGADVDAAIAVLIRLIERAEAVGIAGWRQASAAAREGEAMPEPPPPD